MRLLDILSEARVRPRVEARSKQAALRAVAELFASGSKSLNADGVLAVLEERERLASTGVGSGVAIPHGRLAGHEALQGALLMSADGIPFEAVDGAPVRIIFAVIGPAHRASDHLRVLARLSRVLRNEKVRAELLAAPDAHTAFQVLTRVDSEGV